jgi:hypothetical protein
MSTDAYLQARVEAATEEWWQLATSGHHTLYLAYRPTDERTGEGGELRVVAEDRVPEGMEIATPERMRLNVDREYTRAWIARIARRLPILPTHPRRP